MIGSGWSRVTAGIAVLVGIAGLSDVLAVKAAPPEGRTALVEFTPDGKLKRPVGYRQWVYVGTPLTPNDLNGGEAAFPEFHAVYIDPESFAHYQKTGEFRDGTVMIKELKADATKQAAASCNACRETSAAKDDVFSQYYPVLRAAAPRSN